MGQTLPKNGGGRFDSGGKYNTIGGMAANMIEEYTFRVEYLGSLMLNKAATGLAVVQKPLRELYLNNIRKSDQKLRAQERTIKVRPEGILMIFKDSSSGPPKHVFYEMSSIHFKDCVCFVTRRGSDKKIRGGFEPLDEHRKGSSDSFFSMLEKKHYFLAEKKHPALFVCIMRRPLGVKALDCHVFVMASHKEALQIVDIVNQLQFKGESLLTESSKTMPYNQAGNDKVTMYRPTENPSQQISGQRYELRDEFFRPQSYDQYMGDSRNQRGPLPDAIPNVRNDANVQQYGGVTVFRNRTDDYGRPGTYEREDVRMRHPVTRNQLNASFDDRRYLSANTSFDDDRRKPNGNLSFDENRRPFSMFQEPAYERHQEQPPPGYSQRFSNDDAVLGGRPVSGGGKINRTEAPPTNVVYRQQRHPHGKPVDSPNHDATVQELTSAFERENQKKKNMTSTPVTRPLSPTPKTAPKPDRTSGQLSPSGVGKTPSPLPSPGWGPVASMSNLESRQELERDKRASDPPPVEVQEDTSKTRPVAKVPPHLVAGVKVLPTEFKVPLRKTSPQTSPRCEDPNRYNNLAINSDFEDDYPLKAYQHSNNNNYNNRHNSDHQSHNRNSGGNYRGHVHPEIPYSHGPPINQSFQSDSSRDHGYSSYNVQNHRASDGDDWGYRDVSRGGPPAYSGPKGVRDPATGEIDDPPGSLKDKEIASLVSNIYIGQAPGANTNFEQSLGYYP